jgi:zinc transporter ZupT
MNWLPLLLALTTFFSTTLGGLFALRNKDRLHRILGFTAGVLLGVVAFDLMPEIISLVQSTGTHPVVPMIALVVGFLLFHAIEKLTLIHSAHNSEYEHHDGKGHSQRQPRIGVISAIALSAHSFFDGVGIGLAFQVSTGIGLAVAVAVIAHDFADGLNTVTLMLVNKNSSRRSFGLLMLDATTPLLGAASSLFFHLSDKSLLIYLGFFVGFLLYIGASDILPEAHADHPSGLTLLLTILGAVFIFIVTRVSL